MFLHLLHSYHPIARRSQAWLSLGELGAITNFLATFPLLSGKNTNTKREYQSVTHTTILLQLLMEEEDSSICSPDAATANWTTLMGYNDSTLSGNPERWEEEPWTNLTSDSGSNSTSMPSNLSIDSSSQSRMPAAVMIPTGIMLYVLSLLTFVGNAMVLHAIRTDKRLQTVSLWLLLNHYSYIVNDDGKTWFYLKALTFRPFFLSSCSCTF